MGTSEGSCIAFSLFRSCNSGTDRIVIYRSVVEDIQVALAQRHRLSIWEKKEARKDAVQALDSVCPRGLRLRCPTGVANPGTGLRSPSPPDRPAILPGSRGTDQLRRGIQRNRIAVQRRRAPNMVPGAAVRCADLPHPARDQQRGGELGASKHHGRRTQRDAYCSYHGYGEYDGREQRDAFFDRVE